jgi:adenosylmethionine-8-amino-7-oxononanoate aminotransferase
MQDGENERLNWYDAGRTHLLLPGPADEPLAVIGTYGSRIILDDERELIDGTAAFGAACHGYNHPHIGMAVGRQLERMPHVAAGGVLHHPGGRLAERLAKLLPRDLDYVALTESGTDAMAEALDMAARHGQAKNAARQKFLVFSRDWHVGAFSPPHIVAPLPENEKSIVDFDRLVARHAGKIAGIVVEPLVQTNGMRFHGIDVLRRIRAAADAHGLLLIFDERFTGFGRTGRMFGAEEAVVIPDIIVLANALGAGTLPIGAAVASRRVHDALDGEAPTSLYDASYRANPMACAAAVASLELFEQEPRLEQVAAIEKQLKDGLALVRTFRGVREVRIKGAIGVIEFRKLDDPAALTHSLVEAGVYLRPFGKTLSLTPALTIEPDELALLIESVATVLSQTLLTPRRHPRRRSIPGQEDLPF